jgi:crossover junction endodeoxyribonuclease RuvC
MAPRIPGQQTAYIGIDPGQLGGIAVICGSVIDLSLMPGTHRDIWDWFDNWCWDGKTVFGIIEKAHAMPKQGVTGMFRYGMGYGALCMALTAARIPFEEVHPRVWMRGLGISPRKKNEPKAQWKQRLRRKAQQLFPSVEVSLKTADALLIAEYCRRISASRR